ncbi:MAG: SulP family inorganic anion transporter [Saprospiraceae bacterium]|nr:SulP family inorganic anion transporter [Saprospiraceae bacterium]
MSIKRSGRYYALMFRNHDFRASITLFFVALPLCLGVALASNAPVYSGFLAGIIGGIVVTLFSNSSLSVSGPAAGLTAICASSIITLGSFEAFTLAVAIAGLLQLLLGFFRLGEFTHFIPSAVIKGMLAAIGVILISKQIPMIIGYGKPDFWRNELLNIITLDHAFQNIEGLLSQISAGAILVSILTTICLLYWNKLISKTSVILPASFVAVLMGSLLAWLFQSFFPQLKLESTQFVTIPGDISTYFRLPDFMYVFKDQHIWQTGVLVCFVATLETLLSVEAIDKLDPLNRITSKNRELKAQGVANFASGLLGGLPITAVIVRSSANAEAGARTKLSSFTHGIWLLLAVLFAVPLINHIPYAVLAVILLRTGYNLAKPDMILSVYRQGREQFIPFMVTLVAILFTDLLIGVVIGVGYSVYFLIKHTYRAGFRLEKTMEGHITHYKIQLALNVSFLNKKRINQLLDDIPEYSVVEIIGTESVYIDHDVLEIIQSYKSKAPIKHIQLAVKDIPEVKIIRLH